jgi:tyrosine-protein kinase Etk/Wzc
MVRNQMHDTNQGASQRVTLTDILIALGEEKRLFLGIWLLGSAAVIAVVLSLPRVYSASAVILPPQQQQSSAMGALAQLGALAGVAGGAVGVKTPEEMYVALLKTQNLQAGLVGKLKLKERYQLDSPEEARLMLSSTVQVSADKKSGLITITADDKDPVFAAQLANAHVDELRTMLSKLAVTEAQQRRTFFEQQVGKAQTDLRTAEVSFRKEQEQNGFVVVQALAESGARAQIELQSQIAAREVQIKALGRFMTPQSQEIQRLTAEVAALRQQLSAVQGGRGADAASAEPTPLGAIKAFREMKVQEASLEVLVRQLEIAKLDEAKEGPLLQQVDVATPPEFPSKPKRTYLTGATSLLFFLVGVVVAYVRWIGRRRLANPLAAQQWQKLKDAWL